MFQFAFDEVLFRFRYHAPQYELLSALPP